MMNRALRSLLLGSAVPLLFIAQSGMAEEERLNLEPARRDNTVLCTDGKAHYVAIAPHDIMGHEIFYGDGKRFYQVPHPPPRTLSGLYFLDPRVLSKTGNPSFRGV